MAGFKGMSQRSRQHKDMLWVYEHPEGQDGSPMQKILRKEFAQDPSKFLLRLEKMERDWRSERKVARAVVGELEEDEGTTKAIEHLERVIGEYNGQTVSGQVAEAGQEVRGVGREDGVRSHVPGQVQEG